MDIKKLRVATLKVLMGGDTQKIFAEKYGFNASYLSQILNGHRELGEKTAVFLENKIGLQRGTLVFPMALDNSVVETLLKETGLARVKATDTLRPSDMARNTKDVIDKNQSLLVSPEHGEMIFPPSRGGLRGDIWITHSGLPSVEEGTCHIPEFEQYARLNPRYLREMGVKFRQSSDLKLLSAWDQSMEPTIKQNDLLVVDVSVREFGGDGVYLIALGGRPYVKRLQVSDESHFEIISDNVRHKDRTVLNDEVRINGRVILVWGVQFV